MKREMIFLFLSIALTAMGQIDQRREIYIPEIPGYKTLKCDFHTHTVFSDGTVWPTVRVDEAWLDGLDVIAITDHVEYTPHQEIILNRNSSWEIARERAHQMGIILIRGAEITRKYPFGHFNCLFTSDNELLNRKDSMEAMTEALRQGAVFQWNHPGWQRPREIPVWEKEQTEVYSKKMMHLIEIVNETSYYPLAHQWAIEKNLGITANTDIHGPVYMNYGQKVHRPMTLVFAREKSEEAVKEALLAGRTAVYHMDTLMGKEEFLKPLFQQSLKIRTPVITIKGKQWIDVVLENVSDIPLMLSFKGGSDEYAEIGKGVYVPAHGSARLTVKGKQENYSGKRTYAIPCVVDNYYVAPRKGMNAVIEYTVIFEKK